MNLLWSLPLLFTLCSVAPWVSSYGDFISANMEADMERLKKHFRTRDNAFFDGTPVFPQKLDDYERSRKELLLQEILDVYVRILSDMQNHTQDREVKKSLIQVRGRVEDLRNNYFQGSGQSLKKQLQHLWNLKTTNFTIQRKAVRELLPLFKAASELGSRIHKRETKRRKGRQAVRTP